MDRFAMQCALGYVTEDEEAAILLEQRSRHPLLDLKPVVTREEMLALCRACCEVRVTDELRRYIVTLVAATRKVADVQLPASPRASIALMKVAQAVSLFEGRDFLLPETVQDLAADVIAHRLVMQPEARFAGRDRRAVVAEIIESIPAPV
jgi:MoxR-like ATPase